jgi:hypothetical protein
MQCVLHAIARAETLKSNRRAAASTVFDVRGAEEAALLKRAQRLLIHVLGPAAQPPVWS